MNEFTFFADPAVDRVVSFSWQLAQELHVTTARLVALEQLLVRQGVLAPGQLDSFRPTDEEATALGVGRDEFVARLMRVLTETDDAAAPLRAQFAARMASAPTPGQAAADDAPNPSPSIGDIIRKEHS